MILVIGIFIAVEPRLYERGVAWMLPLRSRDGFYRTADRMGFTLRRLMAGRLVGMVVEGVGTWLLLLVGGVPMAALLGLLTGLLAFIPNIGAIVSGVLMVAGRLQRRRRAGPLGDRRLFHRPDRRRLSDRPLRRPQDRRPRARRWCSARSCCSARCSGSWACCSPIRSSR